MLVFAMFFFFFSSRRRHTRCSRDWSSDVCSSDLRLKFAEAQVEADLGVHVLVETPVVTQPAAARGDLVVVREHGATVAHRREILRRVERERGGAPEGADAASVPRGALGLGAVLEHPEAEAR